MLKRDRLIIIVVGILLLLFPVFLNWVLQWKAIIPIVAGPESWLSFWPVYLSAIASFGMIFMTYLILRQGREQMDDMKKREAEERRARLVFSVVVYQAAYYLRIFNVGKENAYDVKLNFNEEFINQIEEAYREYYIQLSKPDFIEAGKSIYIFIGWCDEVDKKWDGKNIVLSVKGSYNTEKYLVEDTLDMRYFIGKIHFMVKGELETIMEQIKDGLVPQIGSFKPLQKSLDDISYTMISINSSLVELLEQLKRANYQDNNGDDNKSEEVFGAEGEHSEVIPILRD